MIEEKRIDEWIRARLEAVDPPMPPGLENRVKTRLKQCRHPAPPPRTSARVWLGLAAAALFTVTWLAPIRFRSTSDIAVEAAITEIRTRFEIPEKNITIVWVQTPDFELRRNQI